jgi:hypothetical protein
MKPLLCLTLIVATLFGVGCTEEDDPVAATPGTVSGTITYPAPADGKV